MRIDSRAADKLKQQSIKFQHYVARMDFGRIRNPSAMVISLCMKGFRSQHLNKCLSHVGAEAINAKVPSSKDRSSWTCSDRATAMPLQDHNLLSNMRSAFKNGAPGRTSACGWISEEILLEPAKCPRCGLVFKWIDYALTLAGEAKLSAAKSENFL